MTDHNLLLRELVEDLIDQLRNDTCSDDDEGVPFYDAGLADKIIRKWSHAAQSSLWEPGAAYGAALRDGFRAGAQAVTRYLSYDLSDKLWDWIEAEALRRWPDTPQEQAHGAEPGDRPDSEVKP